MGWKAGGVGDEWWVGGQYLQTTSDGMLSLGHGSLSKITGVPPRGHVTALHTSAPCESNRKGVRFGERSGPRKQRGSEMKGRKREQTTSEPFCAHCPFVTKEHTNKPPSQPPTKSFGGRAALPLFGTNLNYPMRSQLGFITKKTKKKDLIRQPVGTKVRKASFMTQNEIAVNDTSVCKLQISEENLQML